MEAALDECRAEDLGGVSVFTHSGGNFMRNKVQDLIPRHAVPQNEVLHGTWSNS